MFICSASHAIDISLLARWWYNIIRLVLHHFVWTIISYITWLSEQTVYLYNAEGCERPPVLVSNRIVATYLVHKIFMVSSIIGFFSQTTILPTVQLQCLCLCNILVGSVTSEHCPHAARNVQGNHNDVSYNTWQCLDPSTNISDSYCKQNILERSETRFQFTPHD